MSEQASLPVEFAKYFEIVHADTPELKSQAFQLRYQVYCLESRLPGFDATDYPNGEEIDEYDEYALHALLLHRPTGSVAGTVRLIIPQVADPLWIFPIEAHAGPLSGLMNPAPVRSRIAEVSRLIVAARFRRRLHERDYPDGGSADPFETDDDRPGRRHAPHPMLGLLKACLDFSWNNQIAFWYAGMEPRLKRFLERFGIVPHEIASSISYHGTVNAYLRHCGEMMGECAESYPETWKFFTDNGEKWSTAKKPHIPLPSSPRPVATEPAASQSNKVRHPEKH